VCGGWPTESIVMTRAGCFDSGEAIDSG